MKLRQARKIEKAFWDDASALDSIKPTTWDAACARLVKRNRLLRRDRRWQEAGDAFRSFADALRPFALAIARAAESMRTFGAKVRASLKGPKP